MMQLEWNFVQLFTSRSITYVQEVAVEALDFSTRTLRVTKVRNGEEESFEYCELLVQISSSRQIRAIIYRTPHSEDHRVRKGAFLSEFSSFMESIILSKDHLLILGDFNIRLNLSTDADTVKFVDLLESLGLEQHLRGPTHTHGNTLNFVITRKMENIIARPLSDLYNGGQDTPLSSSELYTLVRNYNVSLRSIMGHHTPLKRKTVRARPQVAWHNADIAEAKRRHRKAERRWRKTRLPEDLETFKRLKNHVTYISTKARKISYVDFMSENGGDQGRLFMATSALLPPKDDLCFAEYVDDATLAYEIGRFFHRMIINILTDLDAAS